jgi:hypothetical protein
MFATALFGVPSLLLADPADHERRGGEGRVILFSEANYRGASLVLYPGDAVPNFADANFEDGGSANDKVSSIRIEGRVQLFAYTDGEFRGDALRVSESVSNLAALQGPSRRGDWNDIISSAKVGGREQRRPRWSGGTGRGDVRGPHIELYSEANYRGSRFVLTAGDRISNLADVGFEDDSPANDKISSIRVVGDVAVVIHADGEFRGESLRVSESIPNLAFRSRPSGGRSWNDCISSVAVTTQDSRSAERIVTRAYREVLKRDPDPEGMRNYSRLVLEEGWTETQVRESLRASEEYREQHRRR